MVLNIYEINNKANRPNAHLLDETIIMKTNYMKLKYETKIRN